nr:hypothetical protein [uncultured Mediterranean phage uvMED]
MLERIKKIFKRKPKAEKKVKQKAEPLILAEDKTFENEIVKPQVNETVAETKLETKSSLTFGE